MDLINVKQKEALREWSERSYDEERFQSGFDAGVVSYYQKREYKGCREIMEYDIADAKDILSLFNEWWGDCYDDEIKKIMIVAILKAENKIRLQNLNIDKEKEDTVPDFIYAF